DLQPVLHKSDRLLGKLIPIMVRQAHHERNQHMPFAPGLGPGQAQSLSKGLFSVAPSPMAISKARYGSRMALIGSAWTPWWMRPAGLSTLPNLHEIAFTGWTSAAHPPLTPLGGPRALGQG